MSNMAWTWRLCRNIYEIVIKRGIIWELEIGCLRKVNRLTGWSGILVDVLAIRVRDENRLGWRQMSMVIVFTGLAIGAISGSVLPIGMKH